MARILIAGCGDIGTAAGQNFAADGHNVVGLKRHPPANKGRIMYVKADLSISDEVEKLDSDFDLVIYILTPDQRSEQAYRSVFESGVSNLLNFFSNNNPETRFIFVSSTSVYGQTHGEWVGEESVTEPGNINGKIILQAERRFLAHSSSNCIIRFSGIYGRDRSRLLQLVARGGEVQYQPAYYTNRIHRDDCVAVLRFISNRMIAGDNLESVYIASDDEPAAKWDVFCYLADRLGVDRPEKAILPQGSDQNKRCSNRRLKKLGYSFIYKSYREGYGPFE
jgi:nucleoside-diphosphate-sugar epimerase